MPAYAHLPVPPSLVRQRGKRLAGDIVNVALHANTDDAGDLWIAGACFYEDESAPDGWRNALFVSRFGAADLAIVEQRDAGSAHGTRGIYVDADGRPAITLDKNGVVVDGKEAPGPFLRDRAWSVFRTRDSGGASGPAGSASLGTLVLARADGTAVATVVEDEGFRKLDAPLLRGAPGHVIFDGKRLKARTGSGCARCMSSPAEGRC